VKNNEKSFSLQDLVEGFLFSLKAEGHAPRTHEYYAKLLRHLLVFSRDQCWPQHVNQLESKHLRQFLSWVSSRSYEQQNIVKDIHFKAPPPPAIQPYNLDELKRLLSVCELDIKTGARFIGLRNKAMVLLFIDSGLRLSELAHIKLYDICSHTVIVYPCAVMLISFFRSANTLGKFRSNLATQKLILE
jgi:site-specific recombinase XerD